MKLSQKIKKELQRNINRTLENYDQGRNKLVKLLGDDSVIKTLRSLNPKSDDYIYKAYECYRDSEQDSFAREVMFDMFTFTYSGSSSQAGDEGVKVNFIPVFDYFDALERYDYIKSFDRNHMIGTMKLSVESANPEALVLAILMAKQLLLVIQDEKDIADLCDSRFPEVYIHQLNRRVLRRPDAIKRLQESDFPDCLPQVVPLVQEHKDPATLFDIFEIFYEEHIFLMRAYTTVAAHDQPQALANAYLLFHRERLGCFDAEFFAIISAQKSPLEFAKTFLDFYNKQGGTPELFDQLLKNFTRSMEGDSFDSQVSSESETSADTSSGLLRTDSFDQASGDGGSDLMIKGDSFDQASEDRGSDLMIKGDSFDQASEDRGSSLMMVDALFFDQHNDPLTRGYSKLVVGPGLFSRDRDAVLPLHDEEVCCTIQ